MAQVAVRLTEDEVAEVDRLVSEGTAKNRSDAVRTALHDFLARRREQAIVARYAQAAAADDEALDDWAHAAQAWEELPPWDGPVPDSW